MLKTQGAFQSRPRQEAVWNRPSDQNEEISLVAYQLYERRGREDGHDLEDWLKAEEIVRRRRK